MKPLIAALALAATAAPAFAHPGLSGHDSLLSGLTHPLLGPDHLLAMVAIGLWAAVLGGRALWALPAGFLTGMALGFGLGVSGLHLPMVEPMILASVLFLGVILTMAIRLPLPEAVASVAILGLFHGNAHGIEAGMARMLPFGIGFLLATVALHGAGTGLAAGLFQKLPPTTADRVLKGLGALTSAAGLALVFASA